MKKAAVLFIMFLFMCRPVLAAETEIAGEELYNGLVGEVLKGMPSISPMGVINSIFDSLRREISETKGFLKAILLTAVAAGILKILSESFENGETGEAAFFACFAVMATLCVKIFAEVAGYGAETIRLLCGFITKFEPVFVGLLASSGAITQAAAFRPIMSASVYILSLLVDKCILPMTYFSAILGIVNSISGRVEIGTLNKLMSSGAKWLLTGVLTLFSAILAIYGFGTSAMNGVAAKGIKFAAGTLVPVVGGILSDTVEAVISGTNLLKSAVGTAGMITVILTASAPAIKIWVMLMLLRVTAAIIEPFSDKRITEMLLGVANSVSTVFSMVITSVMLFVISIGIILASTGVSM